MDKNITLFGGKNIVVHHEPAADGTAVADETIKVRQIPVREYEGNFMLVEDEPALVGFFCSKPKAWALTLTPESYEEVLATGREVNEKGFFTFYHRRMERGTAEIKSLLAAGITLEEIQARAAGMQPKSHSPTLSPKYVQPPVR